MLLQYDSTLTAEGSYTWEHVIVCYYSLNYNIYIHAIV